MTTTEPTTNEIIAEIQTLREHTQRMVDNTSNDALKNLLTPVLEDLDHVEQNIDNMTESQVVDFLTRTCDVLDNRGAVFEQVS